MHDLQTPAAQPTNGRWGFTSPEPGEWSRRHLALVGSYFFNGASSAAPESISASISASE
jgi:hypothetical protein